MTEHVEGAACRPDPERCPGPHKPSKRARISVVWDQGDKRWQVKLRGFSPVSAKRKRDAVVIGIQAAKEHAPSELLIHRMDGVIQDARSYGTDPSGSRG